ncbi:MAG: 4-deoxy-4-formamido-L-arabinose-phosphoundecaprenol deformylase [Prolixibacteraceae bacterium]|nr:4-deoxy-4-formamido-L-arabinose-phosphoundecaprenol deformylase [Burkholderiales bacterium]
MNIALKIDANTYRGTRHGVPRLVELLTARNAGASFLFSLGPDHTGRAITRVFRAGFLRRMRRTSVLRHYGVKTLLYGTLLPAPDIGRECAGILREARDAGFEVGIHAWDRELWQHNAGRADAQWTRRQMDLACERFQEIFDQPALLHGAAGWQMNRHAYRLTQRLGFDFCSDTRGTGPFVPVFQGEIVACPQLPTTLPTLDEMIGLDGVNAGNVVERLLEMTGQHAPTGHVFTLQAEMEGMKLAPLFEQLMDGWRKQGHELVSLGGYLESLAQNELPRHEIATGPISGRNGILALQGREFLAPV